ncbi:hypothetical protein [Sinomonas mesophila]|uniref:hypothetical protein n=1 Tax=Sinomonas mesophila TaxID=1531955 RepID=UPI000985C17C|nr:hypothetical protein [Sinomonas mesophila]
MSGLRVDEQFSTALRAELVSRAERAKPARRARLWIGAGALAGAGLLGGVAATAAGLLPLPGGEQVTPLASPVTETYTGTATVELGPAPEGATGIEMELTCLTPGSFRFPDGASLACSPADAGSRTGWAGYTLPLAEGQDSVTIETGPESRWQLKAEYVKQERTEWGVNARGETYGVEIPGVGVPDLLAVIATNGREGYVYARDLSGGPGPTSPEDAAKNFSKPRPPREIPVYLSDGETQIGIFEVTPGR